jgi:ribosomal protein S18 acetylase RimI-like enzyme
MVVRDLAWGDFRDLLENYYALYDEVRENPDLGISLLPDRPSLGEEVDWFAHLFRGVQEGVVVASVAEEEGRAIGLCTVHRKAPTQESRHIGVLGISVARAWRAKGIGRALLTHVIDRCRVKFELLELSVFVSNTRARELYRSVGFRSWGVLPNGILREGRHTDLEHMFLELEHRPSK